MIVQEENAVGSEPIFPLPGFRSGTESQVLCPKSTYYSWVTKLNDSIAHACSLRSLHEKSVTNLLRKTRFF